MREPSYNCDLCPRLHDFISSWRQKEPTWHNGPVAPFMPKAGAQAVRLLIVGLAPGLRGANRTGRPFTGDYAGTLLYNTLKEFGFAKGLFNPLAFDTNNDEKQIDTLELIDAAIVNSVRCVPPENKPIGAEINQCRQFFAPYLTDLPHLKAVITLGSIAHQSTIRALGAKVSAHPFGHNVATDIGHLRIISSYHCSRYNTNTGKLTDDMFRAVFESAKNYLEQTSSQK